MHSSHVNLSPSPMFSHSLPLRIMDSMFRSPNILLVEKCIENTLQLELSVNLHVHNQSCHLSLKQGWNQYNIINSCCCRSFTAQELHHNFGMYQKIPSHSKHNDQHTSFRGLCGIPRKRIRREAKSRRGDSVCRLLYKSMSIK